MQQRKAFSEIGLYLVLWDGFLNRLKFVWI